MPRRDIYHTGTNEERFWAKIQKGEDCWLWTPPTTRKGYGRFWKMNPRQQILAHRYSWELHFGPVPSTMRVLHRCDVRRCVRPEHLFLGTQVDNMADMKAKGRGRSHRRDLTHCKRGHAFTPDNTIIRINGGRPGRTCRECMRYWSQQRRQKRPA